MLPIDIIVETIYLTEITLVETNYFVRTSNNQFKVLKPKYHRV